MPVLGQKMGRKYWWELRSTVPTTTTLLILHAFLGRSDTPVAQKHPRSECTPTGKDMTRGRD
jgi:hypothetical protein